MSTLRSVLDALLTADEPCVLGTLVGVQGSSYRGPGAKVVLSPTGIREGLISGGCLENDLVARVESVLAEQRPQLVQYDLGSDLDRVWGTGMGCEGKADILLMPFLARPDLAWARSARDAQHQRHSGVLFTTFAAKDPQKLGTITWWCPEDPATMRQDLLARIGQEVLETGKPDVVDLDSTQVLVEPVLPPRALWIYGASENARPLADIASRLGWCVGVLDHRPALVTPERFPQAWRLHAGPAEDLGLHLTHDARSAGVVMSHGFDQDLAMVRQFLSTDMPYVGLQGNRRRSAKLIKELEEGGFPLTREHRRRLHAPMGLDLGAESPEIIALSVVAEIAAVMANRRPLPLRERDGSIHG